MLLCFIIKILIFNLVIVQSRDIFRTNGRNSARSCFRVRWFTLFTRFCSTCTADSYSRRDLLGRCVVSFSRTLWGHTWPLRNKGGTAACIYATACSVHPATGQFDQLRERDTKQQSSFSCTPPFLSAARATDGEDAFFLIALTRSAQVVSSAHAEKVSGEPFLFFFFSFFVALPAARTG